MRDMIRDTLLLACGLSFSTVVGCDLGAAGDKHNVIKTSHDKIAKRFQCNCDEASEYYSGKVVCLSGKVDTVYEFGTVVLVSDSNDHFPVHFAEASRHELIDMNVGDDITVGCRKISSRHIGDCEVIK